MHRIMRFVFLLFLTFFIVLFPVRAQESPRVVIHFFWASGCPHCEKERDFLSTLKDVYPSIEIQNYEITQSKTNRDLLLSIGKELSIDINGVPFTLIGKTFITGYLNDETTGEEIKRAVEAAMNQGCEDIVEKLCSDTKNTASMDKEIKTLKTIHLPVLGKISLANVSLPVLTIAIALVDGFNPCAMWTLLFLISLLLGMKDRKRMWILGTAFIASSALVYFLFLSAWLHAFLFFGFVVWMRILISLVAVGAGLYNIREYIIRKDGGCAVMGNSKRQKVFTKLRTITQNKQFIFALFGIILLAFAVNLVELVCSAGLAAIYTKVLSMSLLTPFQYYAYLMLYVFVFMLDDLFVFFSAMITLQAVGIQSKYGRYSHLIGGIVMGIIGILLLLKPDWLMFG